MSPKAEPLPEAEISRLGHALFRAMAECTPVAPITQLYPDLSIEDAYQIQLAMIGARQQAEASHTIGRKIGVTSKPVQTMLNVHQPDFGHLLSTMIRGDGTMIDTHALIAPRAEGEIAFILRHDLRGPGITADDVLDATDYVMPCIEIVDSRIRDWQIKIQDTVADNASSGLFVLGDNIANPRKLDLAVVGMTVEKNGQIVGTGAGAAALGHPLRAVAWLANTLGELGITLRAGEVILSGALSSLVPVAGGDYLRVSLGGIGSASVHFGREPRDAY